MPGKYWDALMEVAVDHGGYVTPALVAPVGVPAIELRKMVSRGTLASAGHGVYRVPALPHDRYDEFILARLWAAGRGVISHDSALVVHELCDINPTHVHLTIPNRYRISRAGGNLYVIHRADLTDAEITRIDAVTVTTVSRTLHDTIHTVPAYLVREAIDTARQRGAITAAIRNTLITSLEQLHERTDLS
jgi:predicted transcriptional regulator of viral defense system